MECLQNIAGGMIFGITVLIMIAAGVAVVALFFWFLPYYVMTSVATFAPKIVAAAVGAVLYAALIGGAAFLFNCLDS